MQPRTGPPKFHDAYTTFVTTTFLRTPRRSRLAQEVGRGKGGGAPSCGAASPSGRTQRFHALESAPGRPEHGRIWVLNWRVSLYLRYTKVYRRGIDAEFRDQILSGNLLTKSTLRAVKNLRTPHSSRDLHFQDVCLHFVENVSTFINI